MATQSGQCDAWATSGLEMSQNSMRYGWSFGGRQKLQDIMIGIFHNSYNASKEFGAAGNLVVGANAAGFLKIADTMLAYGLTF